MRVMPLLLPQWVSFPPLVLAQEGEMGWEAEVVLAVVVAGQPVLVVWAAPLWKAQELWLLRVV
jgi:hypothetical protein